VPDVVLDWTLLESIPLLVKPLPQLAVAIAEKMRTGNKSFDVINAGPNSRAGHFSEDGLNFAVAKHSGVVAGSIATGKYLGANSACWGGCNWRAHG
jgi:hypothetical protein